MKIYLAVIWVEDTTDADRYEYHNKVLKAFDTYDKAKDFINGFAPDFDEWFYSNTEFIEKNEGIEDGGTFESYGPYGGWTDEYTLVRHFGETDEDGEEWCCDYRDPSSVELLIREMDLN